MQDSEKIPTFWVCRHLKILSEKSGKMNNLDIFRLIFLIIVALCIIVGIVLVSVGITLEKRNRQISETDEEIYRKNSLLIKFLMVIGGIFLCFSVIVFILPQTREMIFS